MRLIDVEKLLNDMKNELEKAVNDENMDKDYYMVIMTSAIALKDFVNRQPTAYDVDKVEKELEEKVENSNLNIQITCFSQALDIFKGGKNE